MRRQFRLTTVPRVRRRSVDKKTGKSQAPREPSKSKDKTLCRKHEKVNCRKCQKKENQVHPVCPNGTTVNIVNQIATGNGTPSNLTGNQGDVFVNVTTNDVYQYLSNAWTVTGNLRGPAGQQGPVGPQGQTGLQGRSGSQISSGIVIPSASASSPGDLHIDTTSGDKHHHKNGSWTLTCNLRGQTGSSGPTGTIGPQGRNGSQVSSGTDVPSALTCSQGDLHIDTSNGNVCQYDNGVWTLTGNLRGPYGPAGPAGPSGPAGSPGAPGQQGSQGSQGPQGSTGPQGRTGSQVSSGTDMPSALTSSQGDLHVDTSNGNVYQYDNGVWTLTGNLRGPAGQQGSQGPTGPISGGSAGGSYVIFTTSGLSSGNYIGQGTSSNDFFENSLVIPENANITTIAINCRQAPSSSATDLTCTLYVNNTITSLSTSITNVNVVLYSVSSGSTRVNAGDLVSVRINWKGGAFPKGVTSTIISQKI